MGQKDDGKWTGLHHGDKHRAIPRTAGKTDPKIQRKLDMRNKSLNETKSGKHGTTKAKAAHLAGSLKKGGGW